MAQCPHCEKEVAVEYRYSPWCAEPLRLKLVEFFRGADDDAHRALRVSRYLPEKRVRVSVWDETGTAKAAVTLDEDEGARRAGVLAPAPRSPSFLDELRALVRQ